MRKVISIFRWLLRVISSAAYKFYWDDCFSRAASLAYTTLFALVPIAAISFSMSGAFGVDDAQIQQTLERFLKQILPPNENNEILTNLQQQVTEYLELFSQAVRSLGTLSIGVLVFTGIALLNTIESALNAVWKVTSDKSVLSKMVNFWGVVSGGPLVMLFSFYWYTQFSVLGTTSNYFSPEFFAFVDVIVPVFVLLILLALLFYSLPSAKVTVGDALLGALFSAVLFELVKRWFATYIAASTAYNHFYGVSTTVPIFLFWIYLTWVVVLFGAEITYQAGSISILSGLRKYSSDLGEVGAILGLRILCFIGERFVDGHVPPSESDIARETGSDPVLVRTCLNVLSARDIITAADPQTHARALKMNPETISIEDVLKAFHSKRYLAAPGSSIDSEESIEVRFLEAIRTLSKSDKTDKPLKLWTLGEVIRGTSQAGATIS